MNVFKCHNGHIFFEKQAFGECYYCDSTDIIVINSPKEIMELAEQASYKNDKERAHILADYALLARVEQLDHSLFERYSQLKKKGFWYS